MKIIRDSQLATLTLVPVETDEEQVVASIVAMLKPEDKLSYGGRGQDGDDDKFCIVHLHVGGREEKRSEISGNVTVSRVVHGRTRRWSRAHSPRHYRGRQTRSRSYPRHVLLRLRRPHLHW